MVPEEKAISLEMSQGNAVMLVQRKETLNLLNSTLQVKGFPVADIPDLLSVLDVENNEYLDVQVCFFFSHMKLNE